MVKGLELRVKVAGFGFRASGIGLLVLGAGFRVQGLDVGLRF